MLLLDLGIMVRDLKLPTRRVVHVGGNVGEEGELYSSWESQVIWFEPRPDAALQIRQKYPRHIVVEAAAGSALGYEQIWLASNGQSSSLMKPNVHLDAYPGIAFKRGYDVPVIPVDVIAKETDGLVVDAQGYEESVLDGASNCLERCSWIYLEVNRAELFCGCPNIDRLDEMLSRFWRIETRWVAGMDWGEALWIAK